VWGVGVLLWEALAGEHPFWGGDMTETSRRIQHGAEPLAALRPDLPQNVLETVGNALLVNPQRRPSAERLAHELRSLPKRRRSRQGGSKPVTPARSWRDVASQRLAPAALTGLATGWVAATLPFYPAGWPVGIAALGAALGFATPRLGLLYALTVAFFPLANISLGLAIVYAAVAACWFALSWRDARAGLLLAVGPLLAPLAALALLPLAAQFARGRARRAAQAGCALLLAAAIAGLRHSSLPFDGSAPPLGLGITGSARPGAVAHALWAQLAAHPALVGEALVLGAAAALLSRVRRRGPWPAAIFGAALLAATALLAPAAAILPLIAAAWLTATVLAFEPQT
jgi:hypothetical protein